MIQTKYPLTITIDENTYAVTVKEPTKAEKEDLKAITSAYIALVEKYNDTLNDVEYKTKKYDLLTKDDTKADEALKVLEELNKDKKTLKTLVKEVEKGEETIEQLLKQRFSLTVSGNDKTALIEEIDEKGISYKAVFDEIAKEIAEAKEGK